MYSFDLKKATINAYNELKSLRKVAKMFQVSHTTVSRWLKQRPRKPYFRDIFFKSNFIVETVKQLIRNDPFISLRKMKHFIDSTFDFSVSKELVRTVLRRSGYTRKKCKACSEPKNYKQKQGIYATRWL